MKKIGLIALGLVCLSGCTQGTVVHDFEMFGLVAPESQIIEEYYAEDRWFGEASDAIIYRYDAQYHRYIETFESDVQWINHTSDNTLKTTNLGNFETFTQIDVESKLTQCGVHDYYSIENGQTNSSLRDGEVTILMCEKTQEMIFLFDLR